MTEETKFFAIHEDANGAEVELEYATLEDALQAEGYNRFDTDPQRSIYEVKRVAISDIAKRGTLFNTVVQNV